MRLLVLLFVVVMFASCAPKNCYMCITTTSVGYTVNTIDTVMKCDFTSKDANTYQNDHTTNAPALTYFNEPPCASCTTVATRCEIPTN